MTKEELIEQQVRQIDALETEVLELQEKLELLEARSAAERAVSPGDALPGGSREKDL